MTLRFGAVLTAVAMTGLVLSAALPGCGGSKRTSSFESDDVDGGNGGDIDAGEVPEDDGGLIFGDALRPPCKGLECERADCGGGTKTSLSGVVYDPAGQIPLYNAIVYIPNTPLDPITDGATCDQCGAIASGSPIVTALTNYKGEFKLDDVPVVDDLPLVIQVGKWRREVKIPKPTKCQDNVAAKNLTRLPKNSSEGHIPKIAITTGGCDPLPCLFARLGIDASEFTGSNMGGRVHVYRGVGGGSAAQGVSLEPQTALWDDVNHLKQYDMVILSCECSENNQTKSDAQKLAMRDYLNAGGRVFSTHFHYTWFKNNPDANIKGVANWTYGGYATPYTIDTTFPKGAEFSKWLQHVGASSVPGTITLTEVNADLSTVTQYAQRWIYSPANGSQSEGVKYMSFNAPVGVPAQNQCGRAVFSDIHVSSGQSATTVPTSCTTSALSAQEKALAFLFFDLSSCVQDDKLPPIVPR